MVGSPQDIQCIVSTVSGVELSSVMISWMEPGGDTITNDSRVTISPTSGSGNDFISILQFAYLEEGEEGTYSCGVRILETNASQLVELGNIIGKCVDFVFDHVQSYLCLIELSNCEYNMYFVTLHFEWGIILKLFCSYLY